MPPKDERLPALADSSTRTSRRVVRKGSHPGVPVGVEPHGLASAVVHQLHPGGGRGRGLPVETAA